MLPSVECHIAEDGTQENLQATVNAPAPEDVSMFPWVG